MKWLFGVRFPRLLLFGLVFGSVLQTEARADSLLSFFGGSGVATLTVIDPVTGVVSAVGPSYSGGISSAVATDNAGSIFMPATGQLLTIDSQTGALVRSVSLSGLALTGPIVYDASPTPTNVPEPTTLLLLSMGLVGLVAALRRSS